MRSMPIVCQDSTGLSKFYIAISLAMAAAPVSAASPLGSATGYAVIGSATVTNTGATTIIGDIGVSPGTALTGAVSITQTGAIHLGDAHALAAHSDARTAFDALAALPIGTDFTGFDLGTVGVLTPGTYSFASSAQLTGSLLLDFTSNPGGRFLFRIGSGLTTASGSTVNVLGGNSGSGIFWHVGSSATLGTGTMFAGNILADQSVTLNTGASIICGRAIALIGAVTMDGNIVSNGCNGGGDVGTGRSDFDSVGFAANAVPEPASWAMLIIGFGAVGTALRRRRVAFTT
jgi:type VI secretion system secreted protein VgrG